MTWFDALALLLVLGYALLGYWTGLIRRVIGLAGLYVALVAASYVGHTGVGMLRQEYTWLEAADARIYLYFGTIVVITVLVEVVGTLYHQELQVSLVAINRLSGTVVGAFTGFCAAVLAWLILGAAAFPLGGSLTATEIQIRNQLQGSFLGPKIANAGGNPVETIFRPALPRDLSTYFGGAGANT